MIAYYRRPEEKGFAKRASDVIRVEILFLSDGYYWCFYGSSNLEPITSSNSDPWVSLACDKKWNLITVQGKM